MEPDAALRLKLYRRLADLTTVEGVDDVGAELADRFGPLPPPVENLLYQLRVKVLALHAGVEAITSDGTHISLRLPGLEEADRPTLQRALGHGVRASRVALYLPANGEETWQAALLAILEGLLRQRGDARKTHVVVQ